MKKVLLTALAILALASPLTAKAAGAPEWKRANIPAFDASGETVYSFGKSVGKNTFYFYGEADNKITLLATDKWADSYWGNGRDGQHILDFTNNLATEYLAPCEVSCLVPRYVDTKDSCDTNCRATGSLDDAVLWCLSNGESSWGGRRNICNKVCDMIGGRFWTRSGYTYGDSFSGEAFTYDPIGFTDEQWDVTNVFPIVPACTLDLSQVLGCKYANGGGDVHP